MSFLGAPSGSHPFLATLPIFAKTGEGARVHCTISFPQKHQDLPPKWVVDIYTLKLLPR
jgi:hypothetical protein